MAAKSRAQILAILWSYDFSPFVCIADIGGGQGHLLRAVLGATPSALSVGEHIRVECYPQRSALVKFVTHPSTGTDDRFGSKTSEEGGPRTLCSPVVTFAKRDDPGDRLPVAGHDDAAALAHTGRRLEKLRLASAAEMASSMICSYARSPPITNAARPMRRPKTARLS